MSVLIPGSAYRSLELGVQVLRATAVLPQTAQTPIYTVTGGLILVTSLTGVVTTAVQAQATTCQFIGTPTVGTAVNLTSAATDLTGKEIGSTVALPAILGGAVVAAVAGGNQLQTGVGYIIATGTIDFKTVASSTGAMRFMLTYIPLDDGASVVAA